MRIASTAQGIDLNALVDQRFGRAKYFIVMDTDKDEFTAADKSMNLNAAQGAGIQAGGNVVELGVKALFTGHVGPKACTTLQADDVSVYTGAAGTVAEAIEELRAGKLTGQAGADVERHWV